MESRGQGIETQMAEIEKEEKNHRQELEQNLIKEAKAQRKVKKTSILFEDSRRTKRIHFLYVLINNSMGAFTALCLCLSLIIKEYELKELKQSKSSNLELISERDSGR